MVREEFRNPRSEAEVTRCDVCGSILWPIAKDNFCKCSGCRSYVHILPNLKQIHFKDWDSYVLKLLKKDINNVLGENCKKSFNEAQRGAFKRTLEMLSKDSIKGIISLPTGAGKTLLAACLSRLILRRVYGRHILVLAPRRIILEQIVRKGSDFWDVFRDTPIRITEVEEDGAKSKELLRLLNKERSYIIAVTPQLINTAYKMFKDELVKALSRVGIVILDEVHHTYNGPKISKVIQQLVDRCKYVIGLSATPTRESRENIGEPIFTYEIEDAMRSGILTRNIKFYVYRTHVELTRICRSPSLLSTLGFPEPDEWKVAIRNRAERYAEVILQTLKKEAESFGQDRILRTAVACPSITEADFMYDALKEKVGRKYVYLIHSKISGDEVKKRLERFRKSREGILVSVNMIDIGFDDRDLEVLVLARPLRSPISYVQLRGRVLRKPTKGWNIKHKYAMIIDLVDNYDRHERDIDRVTKGDIEAGRLFKGDLKGLGDVPEAEGRVEVTLIRKFMVTPKVKRSTPSKPRKVIYVDENTPEESLIKYIIRKPKMKIILKAEGHNILKACSIANKLMEKYGIKYKVKPNVKKIKQKWIRVVEITLIF